MARRRSRRNGPCDIAIYRSGHVDARNNFWGTSGAPDVDPTCLGYAGTMDTEPFLTRELSVNPIKPKALDAPAGGRGTSVTTNMIGSRHTLARSHLEAW
jgi:hypothetical protein